MAPAPNPTTVTTVEELSAFVVLVGADCAEDEGLDR